MDSSPIRFQSILCFFAVFLGIFIFFLPEKAVGNEKLMAGLTRYRENYVKKLNALADEAERNGFNEEAEITRNWGKPTEKADEIRVSPLPKEFWERKEDSFSDGKKSSSEKKSSRAAASSGQKKKSSGGKSSSVGEESNLKKRKNDSEEAGGSDSARTVRSGETQSGQKKKESSAGQKKLKAVTSKSDWETQFRQLRMLASNDYLRFAKRVVSNGHVSLGFSLLMQSLHENPDNAGARKILGYQKTKFGWETEFEAQKRKMGNVWHEEFGWLPKKYVKKYEEGLRFLNGQWVTAEQDSQFHSTIENGWTIETGHFQIVTDASLEEGVRVGQELEKLYRVWKQLFLNYYATESQIKALFAKETAKFMAIPKHRVCLFKSHEEYRDYLSKHNMLVPGSVGVYVSRNSQGVSCFVAGEEDMETMFHEVTHQLFAESCRTNPKNGNSQNYWVIEAAATFMESFHDTEEGAHAVGGFDHSRVRAARIYFNNSKKFVPFEEFVRVNRSTWQNSPQTGLFYAQACGMAHFLVFFDGGKYRDAFGRILFDVYSGRDTLETVAKHTGVSYEILDREYEEYISRNAEEIANFMIRD
ncbi:MAG: hypothetical protein E7028_08635 [Planctomycetaceae bacterium]|nr:hypothetical protein [Planctomycetaceae bacterium]